MEMLGRSDYVSMHAPLNEETRPLMKADHFAAMKPSAIFVNNGRGPTVDETALIAGAGRRRDRGGGPSTCSRWSRTNPENPLLHMDNVIVTPHVASANGADDAGDAAAHGPRDRDGAAGPLAAQRGQPGGAAAHEPAPLAAVPDEPGAESLMLALQLFFLKLFTPFHTFVFRLTRRAADGEVRAAGAAADDDWERGRGGSQTSPLLYIEHEGALLLPASLWGGPRNPAWYYNCVANPEVVVETRGRTRTMRAEPAPEEEDRQRLYDLFKVGVRLTTRGHEARTDAEDTGRDPSGDGRLDAAGGERGAEGTWVLEASTCRELRDCAVCAR